MICRFVAKDKNLVLAERVLVAENFFARLKGLMFSNSLGEYDGLLIPRCNSIHCFFMRYKIDVVFISDKNKIVKVIRNIPPWRMTRPYFSATKVLEMMGGTLSDELKEGDEVEVTCLN